MIKKYALIACDVFQEELTLLGGENPPWYKIEYLQMGLHDHPDELRRQIQKTISSLESDDEVEAIVLAYGLCGNGLLGIQAGRCPLVLPRAHDCISILLGGIEAHSAVLEENPGTYFYSPGWVRSKRVPGPDRDAHIRDLYQARYSDDPELIDDLIDADAETFAHHNCAAYVDITNNKIAEHYCEDCARHLGWQYKRLQGDPAFLKNLITGHWDTDRYLNVPPLHRIAMDAKSQLISQA